MGPGPIRLPHRAGAASANIIRRHERAGLIDSGQDRLAIRVAYPPDETLPGRAARSGRRRSSARDVRESGSDALRLGGDRAEVAAEPVLVADHVEARMACRNVEPR